MATFLLELELETALSLSSYWAQLRHINFTMVYKGKVKGNKQEWKSDKREMMVGKKKGNVKGKT